MKVAKDAASVSWSALKWTGRSTGEVVGAFLGMGSERAIANGRDAGDFIPDIVVLMGTGGLSSAGRATVQGGVAVANGIEKAAEFTKNAIQATATMGKGGELAYAGANLGSGASKAMAAARGAEIGNLAREGVSGAREVAASVSEKSLARDIDLRVKNRPVSHLPREAIDAKADQFVPKNLAENAQPLSKEVESLLGKADPFKKEFLEREGMPKSATSLAAAYVESKGGQIPLAVERGVTYNHVAKVNSAQRGLFNHIEKINSQLGRPNLSFHERYALQKELSNASRLLDYSEGYVPRPKK